MKPRPISGLNSSAMVCDPHYEQTWIPLLMIYSAVVDMYVTQYLFRKYTEATPGQITWAKSRSVCNPVLATIAVKELFIQKYLLAQSPKLSRSIEGYLNVVENVSYQELVLAAWKFDPPKVLADMFEAVIGAIFVDCGFNLDIVDAIIARLMDGVLKSVYPGMPRDPVTELIIWVHRSGCRKVRFQLSLSPYYIQRMSLTQL